MQKFKIQNSKFNTDKYKHILNHILNFPLFPLPISIPFTLLFTPPCPSTFILGLLLFSSTCCD